MGWGGGGEAERLEGCSCRSRTPGIEDKHQELEEAGRGLCSRLQRESGPTDNLVSDCERINLYYEPPGL